jgi:GNAT superfamily N-acetyltransferase
MALCRRLTQRTVYQRFFSVRRLLPEEAHAFANVDYRQRMAVVAEVDDGQEPELVGVAGYGPSDQATADIGLIVADGWQGLGLGSLFLEKNLRVGEQARNLPDSRSAGPRNPTLDVRPRGRLPRSCRLAKPSGRPRDESLADDLWRASRAWFGNRSETAGSGVSGTAFRSPPPEDRR